MGLIRKSSLYQIEEIQKLIRSTIGEDIGEITTKNIKIHHDTGGDIDYDSSYNMSNIKQGVSFGNFGENWGNALLNNNKNSNLMSVNSPLDKENIDTLENFGLMAFWGDMWQDRDPQKVMKFDSPDSELFDKGKKKKTGKKKKKKLNESSEYIQESLKYVKRFDEMDDMV